MSLCRLLRIYPIRSKTFEHLTAHDSSSLLFATQGHINISRQEASSYQCLLREVFHDHEIRQIQAQAENEEYEMVIFSRHLNDIARSAHDCRLKVVDPTDVVDGRETKVLWVVHYMKDSQWLNEIRATRPYDTMYRDPSLPCLPGEWENMQIGESSQSPGMPRARKKMNTKAEDITVINLTDFLCSMYPDASQKAMTSFHLYYSTMFAWNSFALLCPSTLWMANRRKYVNAEKKAIIDSNQTYFYGVKKGFKLDAEQDPASTAPRELLLDDWNAILIASQYRKMKPKRGLRRYMFTPLTIKFIPYEEVDRLERKLKFDFLVLQAIHFDMYRRPA